MINSVGPVTLRALIHAFGSADEALRASRSDLQNVAGIGPQMAEIIVSGSASALQRAERELEFADHHGISVITYHDTAFPERLIHCPSAPAALFYKGNANLNALRILSVVGTRQPSENGKRICADIISELGSRYPDLLIVSGLAYGIDIAAHRAAIESGIPTVGVVAHGLDRIYPAQHRDTAAIMVGHGGILTEYTSGTKPDAPNFVARNRIVAAMADATLVIESGAKGGSLITAQLAFDFSREVLAIPGRPSDEKSVGCNQLIARDVAQLVCSADDIEKTLGWSQRRQAVQGDLFAEADSLTHPNSEQQKIYEALMPDNQLTAAQISNATGLDISQVSTSLLLMELEGTISTLPDGTYKLTR